MDKQYKLFCLDNAIVERNSIEREICLASTPSETSLNVPFERYTNLPKLMKTGQSKKPTIMCFEWNLEIGRQCLQSAEIGGKSKHQD